MINQIFTLGDIANPISIQNSDLKVDVLNELAVHDEKLFEKRFVSLFIKSPKTGVIKSFRFSHSTTNYHYYACHDNKNGATIVLRVFEGEE